MSEYDVQDPYGTYDPKGGNPYEILLRLTALNDEIRSTISKVQANSEQLESSITQQAELIALRVEKIDFTGQKTASLIAQDANAILFMAQELNNVGLVTFSNLSSSGQTVINGGNILTGTLYGDAVIAGTLLGESIIAGTLHGDRIIAGTISADKFYGSIFTVGNGTSTTMSFYASQGSHRIYSVDSAGLRIQSSSSLSLQADAGTIYANNKFWAQNNLQVTGFTELQSTYASSLNASALYINNVGVADVNGVQNMIDAESETIYDWVRLNFVAK